MTRKIPWRFTIAVISIGFSLCWLLPVGMAWANEAPAEHGEGGGSEAKIPDSKKELLEGGGTPSLKGPFIELSQINVTAIYRGQPVRHMNFIFVLEMPDMQQWQHVLDRLEPLRSEFVSELHRIGSSQRGALLKDFDFLKSRLLKVCDKILGPGHVKEILIKASAGRILPGYYLTQPKKRP